MEYNYTRNEWRRCKNTLETSGEDVKLHSKRVYFFQPVPSKFVLFCCQSHNFVPFFPQYSSNADVADRLFVTSQFQYLFIIFSTRFECISRSSPLVSSVFSGLLHSFRVCFHIFSTRFECSFHIFSTRFECIFTSSLLVSGVVSHLLHSFRVQFSHLLHSFRVQFSHLPHSFRVQFSHLLHSFRVQFSTLL